MQKLKVSLFFLLQGTTDRAEIRYVTNATKFYPVNHSIGKFYNVLLSEHT
jgi:hypothetical protein